MKTLHGMNGRTVKKQSGFTLIEIAIVLVIIGLLLGGVLQGQQLIENSRVKNVVNDFNGITAAAFSYQDRYGRLPGDDNAGNSSDATVIRARGDSWGDVTPGDANGLIDSGLSDTFLGTDEAGDFFQHLRAAGFIGGNSALLNAEALPQNAFGGLIGITNVELGGDGTVSSGLSGNKICMSNIGGAAAIALDTQLDDGSPDTGNFRAIAGTSGTNTAPSNTAASAYSEDDVYTVCRRM